MCSDVLLHIHGCELDICSQNVYIVDDLYVQMSWTKHGALGIALCGWVEGWTGDLAPSLILCSPKSSFSNQVMQLSDRLMSLDFSSKMEWSELKAFARLTFTILSVMVIQLFRISVDLTLSSVKLTPIGYTSIFAVYALNSVFFFYLTLLLTELREHEQNLTEALQSVWWWV